MTLKWVTNTSGPEHTIVRINETREHAIEHAQAFEDRHIKGEPKATDYYTVEQLKGMGCYGLYRPETAGEERERLDQ